MNIALSFEAERLLRTAANGKREMRENVADGTVHVATLHYPNAAISELVRRNFAVRDTHDRSVFKTTKRGRQFIEKLRARTSSSALNNISTTIKA